MNKKIRKVINAGLLTILGSSLFACAYGVPPHDFEPVMYGPAPGWEEYQEDNEDTSSDTENPNIDVNLDN